MAPCSNPVALSILLILMGNVMAQQSGLEDPKAGRLSVTGSATVSVTPDVASVYLSVVVSKPTVKEACDVAAATTAAVTAAVAAVAGTEVSTQNINVRQDVTWADGQERVKGFICENSLKVKAVDSNSTQLGATVSDAVDAALKAGGDHMQARRVQNMATELSPELRLSTTNRARKAAVRDAAATAEILAEAAGVTLGPIKTMSDRNLAPAPTPMPHANTGAMAMAAGGAMSKQAPVAIGTADVTATVSAEYAFKNA